jgi:hypothetical protein
LKFRDEARPRDAESHGSGSTGSRYGRRPSQTTKGAVRGEAVREESRQTAVRLELSVSDKVYPGGIRPESGNLARSTCYRCADCRSGFLETLGVLYPRQCGNGGYRGAMRQEARGSTLTVEMVSECGILDAAECEWSGGQRAKCGCSRERGVSVARVVRWDGMGCKRRRKEERQR